jgi:hypothetical protein
MRNPTSFSEISCLVSVECWKGMCRVFTVNGGSMNEASWEHWSLHEYRYTLALWHPHVVQCLQASCG